MSTGVVMPANPAPSPIKETEENTEKIIIVDNAVMSVSPHFSPKIEGRSYGSYADSISYYYLLAKYDWDINEAYKIMLCESGGNPTLININSFTKDESYGLFQINIFGELKKKRPDAEWLLNPENNIDYAYRLYSKHLWKPWKRCSEGSY